MRTIAKGVAWALAGLILALGIAYIVLYLLILSYPFRPYGFAGGIILFCVPGAIFGALIVSRQPHNGVGWALLLSCLFLALTSITQVYTIRTTFVAPGSLPLAWMSAWFGSWMWAPGVAIVAVFLPLLFPDSSLPGRPAKILFALAILLVLVLIATAAVATFPGTGAVQVGPDAQLGGKHSVNNLGGRFAAIFALIPLLALAALVRLGLRLRRSTGEQRQQFKWFAYACGIIVVGVAASAVGNIFSPRRYSNAPTGALGEVTAAMLVASLVAIPIGTGISVLKYRLYDIDIVINRTIVYGLLAVLITTVYVAIVAGVGSVIHSAGGGNLALSIAATALVAVAFQPLRARLQRVANRVVYGKQATPYEVLSTFSEGVAETYAEEELLPRMARLLAGATDADHAEVWITVGHSLRTGAAWPAAAGTEAVALEGTELPALPASAAIPVRHHGELLGALTVTKKRGEGLTPVETQLLDDLARQAGLVLRNAGLAESLKARLDDLRESRKRLVTAQDEERRRLERNLHDGAQQNLVALKVKLAVAKALSSKDPEQTAEVLDQLMTDADEAVETLRDLARGIYPPLLADKGLAAALESQARKATVPVTVNADGVGRYPQDIEAAVYFCALEALQNIQKYAAAGHASVRLAQTDRVLTVAVEDDGRGFDPSTAKKGAGLQNMEDRLDALGGTVEIVSSPGAGATVTVRLPIGGVMAG